MKKEFLTDTQVELEINRLLSSDEVQLARKEMRIRNKRRQYMYTLRSLEKRGRQLAAEGFTMNNLEERLFGEPVEVPA